MTTKENIKEYDIFVLELMHKNLLYDVAYIGAGTCVELMYELGVVVASKRVKSDSDWVSAHDKHLMYFAGSISSLVRCRNVLNHNTYNRQTVSVAIDNCLQDDVIKRMYIGLYGECPNYATFVNELMLYSEYLLATGCELHQNKLLPLCSPIHRDRLLNYTPLLGVTYVINLLYNYVMATEGMKWNLFLEEYKSLIKVRYVLIHRPGSMLDIIDVFNSFLDSDILIKLGFEVDGINIFKQECRKFITGIEMFNSHLK